MGYFLFYFFNPKILPSKQNKFSETSEAWLQRRGNYTRSLAVMSMVGYILGLGDRHPSNVMLNRVTGQILHIDFGDCFEVIILFLFFFAFLFSLFTNKYINNH